MKHPLHAALPTRTVEEVLSVEKCEGLVALSDAELDAITALEWFKSKNATQRTLLVVSACEWAGKGSNQHKRVANPRSPRAAARLAAQFIAGAAHA